MEKIAQYCQKCRTPNKPGKLNCKNCGTRLMIVTVPASLKVSDEIIPSFYEDHLLERVTLLEYKLAQVTEQLAMAYDFIARQNKAFEKDHLIIKSFIDSVLENEPALPEDFFQGFSRIYKGNQKRVEKENRQKRLVEKIKLSYEHSNNDLFYHLVDEGIKLLDRGEEKQGFLTLERAGLLSKKNKTLFLFISENLFKADQFEKAKKYLKWVFEISPQDLTAHLLLAGIYADEGQADKSRKFLSFLVNSSETAVCANYLWGILAAFEDNWKESIVAFKQCLELTQKAELFYLLGCGYFQINQFQDALENFEKAVLLEIGFADAWYMQGWVYSKLGKGEKSVLARNKAFEAKETGAKCLKFYKDNGFENNKTALPFEHFKGENNRLINNGCLRLNKFFRKMVLEALYSI